MLNEGGEKMTGHSMNSKETQKSVDTLVKSMLAVTRQEPRRVLRSACNKISRNISEKLKLEKDITRAEKRLAEMKRKAK